jgi:uncharacterized repeat protein (TIGR03803 family)
MRSLRLYLVLLAAAAMVSAQTYTALAHFDGANGVNPAAALVEGAGGNFYGTASGGGVYGNYGTIFKVTPAGRMTTLYSFCAAAGCPDGSMPFAGLTLAADGQFYGTTTKGGSADQGTVFKISPQVRLTTIYSFAAPGGISPYAGLLQSADGNLYGVTAYGGADHAGTIFRITPSGKLTTLFDFCSNQCRNGMYPFAGLIQGTDGNFYGTTYLGFAFDGFGTVYKVTPHGNLTTLARFCANPNCADGAETHAGLIQATDGNFYGTTPARGTYGNGVVFRVTSDGDYATLYNFNGFDGANPNTALVQNRGGNLYGTTYWDGAHNGGTVFEITTGGTLTTLYNFCDANDCGDGGHPLGSLVQGTDGNLYGTTWSGGRNGVGVVFRISGGAGGL